MAADLIHPSVADDWECVALERLLPVGRVLAATPTWPIRLERLFDGLPEGWSLGLALRGQRIAARAGELPILECLVPCLRQTDQREGSQAKVVAAPIDSESLYPGPRAGRGDVQIEGAAVAVQARPRDGLGLGGGEFAHIFPTLLPTFYQGKYGNRTERARKKSKKKSLLQNS